MAEPKTGAAGDSPMTAMPNLLGATELSRRDALQAFAKAVVLGGGLPMVCFGSTPRGRSPSTTDSRALLRPGELALVEASRWQGKRLLVDHAIRSAVEERRTTVLCSLEVGLPVMATLVLQAMSGLGPGSFRLGGSRGGDGEPVHLGTDIRADRISWPDGRVSPGESLRLKRAALRLRRAPLFVDDLSVIYGDHAQNGVPDLREGLLRLPSRVDLVLVDYLQALRCSASSSVAADLAALAREFGVPVVCVSRSGGSRGGGSST